MRFRTHKEATEFVKALLKAKDEGKREYLTAKLDTVPAWSGAPKDPAKPWVPNGSEVEAVYLSYLPATDKQKEEAGPAKLAGVKLERMSGRLVDVRECADGTCQLLLVSGLRNAGGEPAFRGPNIDKGVLCYLAIGEGLGEPIEDIIARVPQELIDKLKAGKEAKAKKTKATANPNQPELPVAVPATGAGTAIEVPLAKDEEPRHKLK